MSEVVTRYRRLAIVAATTIVVLVLTQAFPQAYPLGRLAQGLLLGVSSGLLALGLVLIYRTTRVINFAYGAMGACAAEVGIAAWDTRRWPWLVCVLIALAAGIVIGLAVDAVMRRFANAPRLVVTVATIGLLQVLVGLQFAIAFWTKARLVVAPFKTDLSDKNFTIGTSLFDLNDAVLISIAPIALVGLAYFLLRTDAGSAVRAVADNTERAALLGIPIWRLTRIVWVLVACLAGVVMILNAPANGLPFSPFVGVGGVFMPALAAAIIAKMDDLPLAFISGVALGVFHAIVSYNVHKASISTVALLVIVLVALLLRRWNVSRAEAGDSSWSLSSASRPLRPSVARLPEVVFGRAVLLAVLGAIALAFPLLAEPARIHTVSGYLIYGIVVVSLVVLSGWVGTISLGQVAIVGVGAVVAGKVVVSSNLDLFAAMVLAGIAGALISVAVGLPALRVRPLFLAVTTLLFAAAMDNFVLNPANFPDWIPGKIDRPVLWKRYPLSSERTMYLVILATLVLVTIVARVLRSGRPGRLMIASRDNERAAAAMAVPVVRTRVAGMAIAGVIAGVGGALTGVLETGVGAASFPAQTSVLVFSMAVVGGLSSVSGALAGVAAVELLIFLIGLTTSQGAAFGGLATGALMLFVLLAFPGGIGQAIEQMRDRYVGLVAKRRGIVLDVGAAAGSLDLDPSPEIAAERAPRPAGAPVPVLACRDIEASYGPLQVLFGVDLDVDQREVVALLGTNGAGKSTVFRVIMGLLPATKGSVELNGEPITGFSTDEIARRGISMMPGGRGIFPTMSVAENLRLACWQFRRDGSRATDATNEMLEMFPILRERTGQLAGNLSGGEQQQLSLAMAFITKPKVMLIDELSLGLAPTIVSMLCDKVRDIHAAGTTIVAVEQSVNVAIELAQEAVFLEKGAVRFTGETAGLLDRPDILRSVFIGGTPKRRRTTATVADAPPAPSRGVGLRVVEVTKTFGGIRALDALSLEIRPGTVTGLIGHNGAGKTTLFDVISGFHVPDGGRIELGDEEINEFSPTQRAVRGLGRSFQEARLFPSLTVAETIAVAYDRHRSNRDWLAATMALPAAVNAEAESFERAADLIDLLGLANFASTPIADLSTGTRRIVELACALAMDPAVLLLDEPSAGIAQRDTEALGPLLRRIQHDTGAAIVIIEHDMALLTSLCDELVALENGSVIYAGKPADVLAHPRVIESYLGVSESAIHRSGVGAKKKRTRKPALVAR